MTKGNKNIYVCVRKVGLEKNVKQNSVRNGTTYTYTSNFLSQFGLIFFLLFPFAKFNH